MITFCLFLLSLSNFAWGTEDTQSFERIGENGNQLAIVDELVKHAVKSKVEYEKRKQIDRFIGKLIGEIEDQMNIPIGRFLRPGERLIPNYPAIHADFDPIFETTDWGGPSTDEVKNALQPVYDVLWEAFDVGAIDEEIALFYGEPNPRISLMLNENVKRQRIRLSVQGTYYQQYTYQFAHELTHLLTNFEESENKDFRWLTEMFAEMGSAYVLMEFARNPPYAPFNAQSWSNYYNVIYGRLNDGLTSTYRIDREGDSTDWMGNHILKMKHSSVERELNWGVARELLPHFIVDPSLWSQAGVLYQWNTNNNDDLQEFLRSWERTLVKRGLDTKLIDLLHAKIPREAKLR